MKLFYSAIIATVLVTGLGVGLVIPIFFENEAEAKKQDVMLTFSVVDDQNLPSWCDDLHSFLLDRELRATIFITGRIADAYPNCVRQLSSNARLDVGSQTYSYVPLDSGSDYTVMLEEVKKGKTAVDNAGRIESKAFKSPLGRTDENIYSLLNRSGILADFTYATYYLQYNGEHYIWFNSTSYDASQISLNNLDQLGLNEEPLIINFDNKDTIQFIRKSVSDLDDGRIAFANASDLTKIELTKREIRE